MTKSRRNSILRKNWVCHNREDGITSVIRFVKRTEDGNYIVAVSRAYKSAQHEPLYSPKFGKKFAYDRMHRYLKGFNFRKNKSYSNGYFVYAGAYDGKPWKASYTNKIIFFAGQESLMNEKELNLWHDKVLPCLERILCEV